MKNAFILLLIFVSRVAGAEESSEPQFAATVICPDKESHRFEHATTLSIFGVPGDKNRAVVQQCVNEFNQTITGLPQQIAIIEDGNQTADIVVNFISGGYRAMVKSTYDHGGGIKHSVLDFSRSEGDDSYGGQFYYRLINHKLYECLGLLDCGPRIHGRPDSFWSIATAGHPDVPMAPTELDRKVIRFAYEKVPSGTQKFKVEQLARTELSQIVVPPALPSPAVAPTPTPKQQMTEEDFVVAALTQEGRLTFRKWVKSPTYSCLGEMVPFQPILADFCTAASEVLKGLPVQPTAIAADSPQADVTVIMRHLVYVDATHTTTVFPSVPPPHYMKNEEFPYTSTSAAAKFPLLRWQITVIDHPPSPNGKDTHPFIRSELFTAGMESLGIRYVGTKGVESLLAPGVRTGLTELDMKMLRFAYEFVPIDASQETIRTLFRQHWDSIKVPQK